MTTTTVTEGGKVNLNINQGSKYVHTFIYQDEDGVVQVLTGYTARMQIRADYDATTTLYSATTSDDLSIDAANGKVTLTIPGATSAAWTWRGGVYDIEIVDPTGEPTRIVKGKVRVDPEVTR